MVPWLANIAFAAGTVVLGRRPTVAAVSGVVALVVGAVGTLVVVGVPIGELEVGFWVWLASFAMLALGWVGLAGAAGRPQQREIKGT
jgi:hypothetical protein